MYCMYYLEEAGRCDVPAAWRKLVDVLYPLLGGSWSMCCICSEEDSKYTEVRFIESSYDAFLKLGIDEGIASSPTPCVVFTTDMDMLPR